MPVAVTVSYTDARTVLGGQDGPLFGLVQRTGNQVLNIARVKCPVDKGPLRASLGVEMQIEDGLPVALIGSNLDYAVWVHEGTGIYAGRGLIFPKNAKVLRWPGINNSGVGNRRYSGGATAGYVYARYTRGQKGQPFLRDALAEVVGL